MRMGDNLLYPLPHMPILAPPIQQQIKDMMSEIFTNGDTIFSDGVENIVGKE